MDDLQSRDLTNPKFAFLNMQSLPRHIQHAKPRIAQATLEAENMLKQLMNSLAAPKEIREETQFRFKSALECFYNYRWGTTRKAVAAVCFYAVAINWNHALTISQICNMTDVKQSDFSGTFYEFMKTFPEMNRNTPVPMLALIQHLLREVNFEPTEFDKIVDITHKIMTLLENVPPFEDSFHIEGKSLKRTILAAAYYAWVSVDVQKRKKFTLRKFFKQLNIHTSQYTACRSRIPALRGVFALVINKISWLQLTPQSTMVELVNCFEDMFAQADDVMVEIRFDYRRKCKANGIDPDALPEPSKNRMSDPVLDETTDEPLDESEIDTYIRPRAEVEAYRPIKEEYYATMETVPIVVKTEPVSPESRSVMYPFSGEVDSDDDYEDPSWTPKRAKRA